MVFKDTMEFVGRLNVSVMRFFLGLKKTEIKVFSVSLNVSLPFGACRMPRNAFQPTFVVFSFFQIFHVLLSRAFAKIFNSIVGSVAVDVVNFLGPKSICHRPSDPVCAHQSIIHAHDNIPCRVQAGYKVSSAHPPPWNTPAHLACLRIVEKNLFEAVYGKFYHER